MITVTEQKPLETVIQSLDKCQKVYIIGCGSCATMLHTGGKAEVLEMKRQLEAVGKAITGWMVIPTTCDPIAEDALLANEANIKASDCVLVMACAFGVQNVAAYCSKSVYPALNTLFLGREGQPFRFDEICIQCGDCVIGQYASVCPVTSCAKGLLCGPCGGAKAGKCEQQPEHDCAWVVIYERMKQLGRLDELKKIPPPKDYSKAKRPRQKEVAVP